MDSDKNVFGRDFCWYRFPAIPPGGKSRAVLISIQGTTHPAVWNAGDHKFVPFSQDLIIPFDEIRWWAEMPPSPDAKY